MIKKSITYKDYDGTERVENHYFNLDEAEIMEMELSVDGGFTTMIEKVVSEQRHPELFKIFKDFVCKSYGEKSADGKYFLKMDEEGRPLYRKFLQTKAYSALMTELTHDAKASAEFVNGILPVDMAQKYNPGAAITANGTAN